MAISAPELRVLDLMPSTKVSLQEVLGHLRRPVKELPCKLFYDARGSALFDRICELEEYYPTRTELGIMQDGIEEMRRLVGPDSLIVEYGSGSGMKTAILLEHLEHPAAYIPIEISKDHLVQAAESLAERFPALEILPVCGDYSQEVMLPVPSQPTTRTVVYFPGSTIGNFHPADAERFLKRLAMTAGPDGGLLIGVDLKKSLEILHHAYNDDEGVTAAFNLNILYRLNRELGSNFDPQRFRHVAFYNPEAGRVEMHLESLAPQHVRLNGATIGLTAGERIWTESSYKYTLEEFRTLVDRAGFEVEHVWTDDRQWFSVQYLRVR